MVKNLPVNAEDTGDVGTIPGQEDPLEEDPLEWQPTPVFLLEKAYRQRNLAGYRQGCHSESDMNEAT